MAQSDGISTTTHFTVMIQFYYFPNTTQVLFWSGGGVFIQSVILCLELRYAIFIGNKDILYNISVSLFQL